MRYSRNIAILLALSFLLSQVNGQYSTEEDDEEYEEEAVNAKATSAPAKPSQSATSSSSLSKTDKPASNSDSKPGSPSESSIKNSEATATESAKAAPSATSASETLAVTDTADASDTTDAATEAAAASAAATTEAEYPDEEDESTTHRLAYIFTPVNNLLQNVGRGNITGIVDNALSIRAPEPVKDLVNMIMSYVFNMGAMVSNGVANAFNQTQTKPVGANKVKPKPAASTIPKTKAPVQKPLPDSKVKVKEATPILTTEQGKYPSSAMSESWPQRKIPVASSTQTSPVSGVNPNIKTSKGRRQPVICNTNSNIINN